MSNVQCQSKVEGPRSILWPLDLGPLTDFGLWTLDIGPSPVGPRPSPGLLQQDDLDDLDRAVERFAHVVEGQAGAGDRGQGLHLDAGPRRGGSRRGDEDLARFRGELALDGDG